MFHVKQNFEFLEKSTPKLKEFSDFVLKWQKSVNLISPNTIKNIWTRHVLDSAQLYPYIPQTAHRLVDMGSGGGFPGIVLALINKAQNGPIEHFYLIESDVKKSVFLCEASRVFELPVTVINDRLERVCLSNIDVVTARALKDVNELITLGQGFISPQTECLFLKGETVDQELAQNMHACRVEKIKSLTSNGFILRIGEVIQ